MTEIKPSFGVIVGRFQTHELTDGHMELFRNVMARHQRVIVFLGCTKIGPTRRNPLDFETRKAMIQEKFPTFTILPLQDKKFDADWSRELDERISDVVGFGDVTLYGARDSFAPYYSGRYKVKELDLEITVPRTITASEVRAQITNRVIASSDFRAGVIYAIGQLYPRCVTTVDVAIMHKEEVRAFGGEAVSYNVHLLLGKKKFDGNEWRFVGGHAEPPQKTDSFEDDVRKEAMEESHLDLQNIAYVGSIKVNDWRYKDEKYDGIKTMFFAAESMTMAGHGDDDLAETKWFNITDVKEEMLVGEHRVLFRMLLKYLGLEVPAKDEALRYKFLDN